MTSGIASLVNSGNATTSSSSSSSAAGIANNFSQFLTLLTTQLKNQNPLDPMDTNQFTQQLVQFAGVEQQLKSNDRLDSILAASKSASTASATSYIGKTVTTDGVSAQLQSGSATWTLDPARAAPRPRSRSAIRRATWSPRRTSLSPPEVRLSRGTARLRPVLRRPPAPIPSRSRRSTRRVPTSPWIRASPAP